MSVLYSEAGVFQSTPPVRGATASRRAKKVRQAFQSTPPVRGATQITFHFFLTDVNFNPRPPCGGRPMRSISERQSLFISIHAPRAGGDNRGHRPPRGSCDFNPRPPCGGRPDNIKGTLDGMVFQSTPPVRGATGMAIPQVYCRKDFNPRPPCGGRPGRRDILRRRRQISIHAPRAGGDLFTHDAVNIGYAISIHAPRAGGDAVAALFPPLPEDFNPRPPCGGRPGGLTMAKGYIERISIHAPRAGGDEEARVWRAQLEISIHAPRAGGDPDGKSEPPRIYRFQSTPPVRGATVDIRKP